MAPLDVVRFGVVGCGYWGPNHIRNLFALGPHGAQMVAAADPDLGRRRHISERYPALHVMADANELLEGDSVDAVVLATPVHLHFEQARRALESGKHVLVEKPFSTSLSEARELGRIAEANDRVLMVGHTYEYAAAVNRIRDIVRLGELGDLTYIRSLRVNLGLIRSDTNVMWDLAPHDISILLYILDRLPVSVQANGRAHVSRTVEDVASITLDFGDQVMANIIVSWLDPQKVRQMTFVGENKMLVYDDISPNEKIKIFDKGVDVLRHWDSFNEFQYSYRYGDIVTPVIEEQEPLYVECRHFLECCLLGKEPRSGVEDALAVTGVLAAAQHSIANGGVLVQLDEFLASDDATAPTTLPVPLPRKATRAPVDADGNAPRRKALVIDAERESRVFVAEALTSFEPGFEVVTAPDVAQASDWMRSFVPDLLVASTVTAQDGLETFIDELLTDPRSRHCRVISLGRAPRSDRFGESFHTVLRSDASLTQLLVAIRSVFDE